MGSFSVFPPAPQASVISSVSSSASAGTGVGETGGESLRVSAVSLVEEINESTMDGSHLIVKCTIQDSSQQIRSHALVDCRASGFAFVDEAFVRQHNLPLSKLREPRRLEVIDGHPIHLGDITHTATFGLWIEGHYESLPAFVTKLGLSYGDI